jgi:hypothetical protein
MLQGVALAERKVYGDRLDGGQFAHKLKVHSRKLHQPSESCKLRQTEVVSPDLGSGWWGAGT